ncbi:MAG: hypothetical protein HWN68_20100 [Desulfobacterales bacterium]|nr:hypothetical protein [Desulfobacterales bacterium]
MDYKEIRKIVYCKKDKQDVLIDYCVNCPYLSEFVEYPEPATQMKWGYSGLYCNFKEKGEGAE